MALGLPGKDPGSKRRFILLWAPAQGPGALRSFNFIFRQAQDEVIISNRVIARFIRAIQINFELDYRDKPGNDRCGM